MILRLVVALLCAAGVSAAHAQESPTLRKIREAGIISIGYRESSVPFSYLDSAQRPVGYSMAICDRIVDAVRQRLGLADLERRLVPVSSATRIPLVTNGTIDLECGVTTERGLDMSIVAVREDTDAFRLVETDRAAAYAMDDVLLRGTIASARHPEEFVVSDEALSVEPYGIMLGKGDPQFKQLADEAIKALFTSGEIHRL